MDYSLNTLLKDGKKSTMRSAFRKMLPLFAHEKRNVFIAVVAVIINALLNLVGPLLVGYVIDVYVMKGNYQGVLVFSGILFVLYLFAYGANYVQMRVMGAVAQRTLWRLRNDVFSKLQELPLAFFNQNKTGDLISRINSDTDKLNQFFSQGLMRFAGNIFIIIGAGIFIVGINWKLGMSALIPAVFIFVFTRIVSTWVGKRNSMSLTTGGLLAGEIQEAIANFKVVLAFNRRDYFRARFGEVNTTNFNAAVRAGVANELFTPVFEFAGNIAQLIVLGVGLYLIAQGSFAVGLLVSFVLYVTRFYDPLREMARLWSTFQVALAAWDRIRTILHLESNLAVIPYEPHKHGAHKAGRGQLEFHNVSFAYPDGGVVLHHVSFIFEKGKTYALVGPTGGGKTTTASLIARLYDPTAGTIYLEGKDIRSYSHAERTQKIGFILQDAFMFAGTVRDNIMYGNTAYAGASREAIDALIEHAGFMTLLARFDKGLDTDVSGSGSLSLGQRQLIAFMRAVLRKPDILILDEATANIDTVTEKMLEVILTKLPADTTRIIIAHRLNTISTADDIFFVNAGTVTEAGSLEHAVSLLLHDKRKS